VKTFALFDIENSILSSYSDYYNFLVESATTGAATAAGKPFASNDP
jgi:hypothetical protein